MQKTKKKNLVVPLTAVLVLALALIVVFGRKSSTNNPRFADFSIPDTAGIQSVFLADRSGCQVFLERNPEGGWTLNKKETALQENVRDMLSVLLNIRVKAPVGKAATENVTKWLASGATKVQVTYQGHRIRLGKIHLWKALRTKTFYMGSPTPDNMGNYAIMEKAKIPYIVYVPGFRGFISPHFSALESDWKSHELLNLRISEIAWVQLLDFENPDASLQILRHGEKHFDILDLKSGQALPAYDTLKLYDHLSAYRKLNFEFFAEDFSKGMRDTVLASRFKELQVRDTQGKTLKITMYHILNEFNTEEYEYNEDFMDVYNRDKFYISLNDDTSQFYICQYFVFDRIIQPLAYYSPENEDIAIPRK